MASQTGYVNIVRVLIDANASVNQPCCTGKSALCIAANNGHDAVVELLLAQPDIVVDMVDDVRWTPLLWATANGHKGIVQQLLDANANTECADENGYTSLMRAVYNHHFSVCALLLQHNANVNHRNKFGATSLYWAADRGEHTVELLLDAKALVDLGNNNSQTPLFAAAKNGHLAILRRLLLAGANVHHVTDTMQTLLHEALRYVANAELVDELLDAGVDPHAINATGWAPLHYAARRGDRNCISSLLKAKVDIDCADDHGDTPLILAVKLERTDAVQLLLESGADWLKKGKQSARQVARNKSDKVQSLFHCSLCGWQGMCCAECRKKYCAIECDKISGQ